MNKNKKFQDNFVDKDISMRNIFITANSKRNKKQNKRFNQPFNITCFHKKVRQGQQNKSEEDCVM
jgi:hypothetical protein